MYVLHLYLLFRVECGLVRGPDVRLVRQCVWDLQKEIAHSFMHDFVLPFFCGHATLSRNPMNSLTNETPALKNTDLESEGFCIAFVM